MNIYTAYGQTIRSEIALSLPLAPVGKQDVDIVIQTGNIDEENADIVRHMPGLFSFSICRPGTIVVDIHDRSRARFIASVVRGELLAALLRWKGYLVIHASAVSINGRAIVFMGHSGAGKSTTASCLSLNNKGSRIITDDVLPLQTENNKVIAVPSFPSLRLHKDVGANIFNNYDNHNNIHEKSQKKEIQVEQKFSNKKVKTDSIFIIRGISNKKIYIEEGKSKKHSFAFILSQIWCRHLSGNQKYTEQDIQNVKKVVNNVKIYNIYRESSADGVAALSKELERLLGL